MNCYFCDSQLSFDYQTMYESVWKCEGCITTFDDYTFPRFSYRTRFSKEHNDNVIVSKMMIFNISGSDIFVVSAKDKNVTLVGTESNIYSDPLIIHNYLLDNNEFDELANRYRKMLPFS